jgi:hypothetical protein
MICPPPPPTFHNFPLEFLFVVKDVVSQNPENREKDAFLSIILTNLANIVCENLGYW